MYNTDLVTMSGGCEMAGLFGIKTPSFVKKLDPFSKGSVTRTILKQADVTNPKSIGAKIYSATPAGAAYNAVTGKGKQGKLIKTIGSLGAKVIKPAIKVAASSQKTDVGPVVPDYVMNVLKPRPDLSIGPAVSPVAMTQQPLIRSMPVMQQPQKKEEEWKKYLPLAAAVGAAALLLKR